MALIETSDLSKTYRRGDERIDALRGVSIQIHEGEFVTVMGPSGSGKSTLLQLLGGLDRSTSGSIRLGGEAIDSYSDARLSAFRRQKLGFIFQFFHLLPTLSAEENVALPLLLDGQSYSSVKPKVDSLLSRLGVLDRARHKPHQLSGGQMQRIAVARALVANPLVLFADEPTGNLDSSTGEAVLELIQSLVRERKQTCVMVTHDPKAARYGTRLLLLRDGRVERDGPPTEVLSGAAAE